MKNLIKTVSFLAVISMFSGAFAATSRVGMVSQAASRRISISGKLSPVVSLGGTTTSATTLLTDAECKDDYRNCLRASDVCGEQFEECPNRMLFHVQMPKCEHVLYKCSSLGLYQLFGTTNIAELGTPIFGGGTGTEIVDYKYPTMNWIEVRDAQGNITGKTASADGSQVGQWIAAGYGDNAYSLAECKRKYERCLRKDDVCGEDFELCTNNKDFMAQAMLCESHLVRCSEAGRDAFYGHETNHSYDGKTIQSGSLIAQWITKGAGLAAYNAVNTCYKVADNCLLDACNKNPVKCMNGQPLAAALMVDDLNSAYLAADTTANTYKEGDNNSIKEGNSATGLTIDSSSVTLQNRIDEIQTKLNGTETSDDGSGNYVITARYVSRYLRNMCREKIGSNRYCYMTAFGKEPKKPTDLVDIDNIDDVYGTIYADRYNSSMREKLENILNKYDATMYGKCADTIKTCVMRSCGSGVGSLCYAKVYGANGQNSVNGKMTYDEIAELCGPIVNTDTYCTYTVTKMFGDNYKNEYGDAFTALFPRYTGKDSIVVGGMAGGQFVSAYGDYYDPLGVIASLNASLSSSFSPAAISMLREQCTRTAQNCVKAMCGKDYEKCYRNRTDIMVKTYNTEDKDFDASMNRMGGILDYTIVTGLCVNTIKASKACDEHFKISQIATTDALKKRLEGADGWNTEDSDSVRSNWIGSGSYLDFKDVANRGKFADGEITAGYRITAEDANSDLGCYEGAISTEQGLGEDGCNYTERVTQSINTYITEQATTTLFQEILQDLEREAQAKYKAELTKRANMCRKQSVDGLSYAGGDGGATYEWVKLKNGKFNSATGFTASQLTRSNDVYNSFCRVRVTITSTDKDIQEILGKGKSDAYFPVGYPINCGSWLPKSTWDELVTNAKDKAAKKWKKGSDEYNMAMAWSAIGATALGATGGGLIANYLNQKNLGDGGFVTSLWSNSDQKLTASDKTNAGSCVNNIDSCLRDNGDTNGYCTRALRDARVAKVETKDGSNYDKALNNLSSGTFDPKLWVALQNDCQDKYDANTKHNSRGNVAGGAVAGGLVGLALGLGVTATVFKAKENAAKNKAEQEFWDTLGGKLTCYVGGAEVTTYGETFSINLDE